jgi:hypothetical protein
MTRSACTNCSSFWSVIWQRTWKIYCALQTSTNIILWLSSKALSRVACRSSAFSLRFQFLVACRSSSSHSSTSDSRRLSGKCFSYLQSQVAVACRSSAFVLRLLCLVASRSSALCSSTLMTMILTCLKRLSEIASQESRVLLCSKAFEVARFLHC